MKCDDTGEANKGNRTFSSVHLLLLLQSECLSTFWWFRCHAFRGSMLARRALRMLGGLVCRLREVASESLILKERTTYLYNSDNIIIYTALAFKLKLPELTLRPFQAIQKITDL